MVVQLFTDRLSSREVVDGAADREERAVEGMAVGRNEGDTTVDGACRRGRVSEK